MKVMLGEDLVNLNSMRLC